MIGGGKYEKEVEDLIKTEQADVAAIIIGGGRKGSGFSLAVRPEATQMVGAIVAALREVADRLEKDLVEHKHQRWQ